MAPSLAVVDPRPEVAARGSGWVLVGTRCTACGHPSPATPPRCPRCHGQMQPATFDAGGVIWATTTSYISPRGERAVPYTLAYVDLDDGPRLLAHVDDAAASAVGARVRLAGRTVEGDPLVAPAS